MGLLTTDHIQATVYHALKGIYGDGVLQSWASQRDPVTLLQVKSLVAAADCKVQKDRCTEAQRLEIGYSALDVRFLVLQYGIPFEVNDDSRLIYYGESYHILSVGQDPARAYWDLRARRHEDESLTGGTY